MTQSKLNTWSQVQAGRQDNKKKMIDKEGGKEGILILEQGSD